MNDVYKPSINHIVTFESNAYIGFKDSGRPLWFVQEEMEYFKSITEGHIVIMGRNTYDSTGLLPNRTNIIVSTRMAEVSNNSGSYSKRSLDDALELARTLGTEQNKDIFIIGGHRLFEDTKRLVDKVCTIYLKYSLKHHHSIKDMDLYEYDWEYLEDNFTLVSNKRLKSTSFFHNIYTGVWERKEEVKDV